MDPANILKINSLPDSWIDRDQVMLHACFQLLTDCVENEKLLAGHVDWTADQEHQDAEKRVRELYEWWTDRKEKESDDSFDPLSEEQFEEDTTMLIELIKMRKRIPEKELRTTQTC